MKVQREDYYKEISDKLETLEKKIEYRNEHNLNDINIHAENIYAGLLNIMFDWNLQNMNRAHKNARGIDLIDKEKKIAVQVSGQITKRHEKIQSSIDKFAEANLDSAKYHFYMLWIKKSKDSYNKNFDYEEKCIFNPNEDILDNSTLLDIIGTYDIDKMKKIYKYLRKELKSKKNKGKSGFIINRWILSIILVLMASVFIVWLNFPKTIVKINMPDKLIKEIVKNSDGEMIKSLEYEYAENGNEINCISIGPQDEFSTSKIWLKDGNVVKEIVYFDEEGLGYWEEYNYDKEGLLNNKVKYDLNDTITEHSEYKYDQNGNEVKCMGYNEDDYCFYMTEKEYSESGQVIKYSYHKIQHGEDMLSYCVEYGYDHKGNIILENVNYQEDSSENYWIKYEYDNNGNRIKGVKYDSEENLQEIHEYIYATIVAQCVYQDHLYEVFDCSLNWTVAKSFCEARGGHLVTITDKKENDIVTSIIVQGSKNSYAIGATDVDDDKNWEWVTGESFSYKNWDLDAPEPTDGVAEDYSYIIAREYPPNKEPGEWVDGRDYDENEFYATDLCGFVCETETFEENVIKQKDTKQKIKEVCGEILQFVREAI